MVFFFTAIDGTLLYMGKDKYENEDLIKYGWPEDIWFHVDNLSSAHVYARLPKGMVMDQMSEELIRDCSQLVKANSIEGIKKTSVTVIYTPWSNLKKEGSMDVGQVGFFNDKLVRKFVVLEKDKDILRRIGKTKDERYPNLAEERQHRDAEERQNLKQEMRTRTKQEKELEIQRKKEKEERSYDRLFKKNDKEDSGNTNDSSSSSSNTNGLEASTDASSARKFEDDFM